MCLNGNCFDFSNYADEKVAVFIAGPGYLEFPWALETALRLKRANAKVTVIDLSDFATPYAMRLRVLGCYLPFTARRVLRSLFFKSESRIENVMREVCLRKGIDYFREQIPSTKGFGSKLIQLNALKGLTWGHLDAFQICQSTFSSFKKINLESTDLVNYKLVRDVKHAIEQTHIQIESLKKQNFDAVFLANGRQPVQAEITIGFRGDGVDVVLYESGGGYIFPSLLKKRLEYFLTSPANSSELREKINCTNPAHAIDSRLAKLVEKNVRDRNFIPFRLNYLTDIPSDFDETQLSAGKNFAFFSTSEWEISILQNYESSSGLERLFESQLTAVATILDFLKDEDRLFLRLHPSDPGNHAGAEEKWKVFKDNQTVVFYPPESRVDSYKLAEAMDGNFVWATFLGYELALRGMPVAIVGDAVYSSCFGRNWIRDNKDLKFFIDNPENVPEDMLAPYSNYLAVGGIEILDSETDQHRQVTLAGQRVDRPRFLFRLTPRKIIEATS